MDSLVLPSLPMEELGEVHSGSKSQVFGLNEVYPQEPLAEAQKMQPQFAAPGFDMDDIPVPDVLPRCLNMDLVTSSCEEEVEVIPFPENWNIGMAIPNGPDLTVGDAEIIPENTDMHAVDEGYVRPRSPTVCYEGADQEDLGTGDGFEYEENEEEQEEEHLEEDAEVELEQPNQPEDMQSQVHDAVSELHAHMINNTHDAHAQCTVLAIEMKGPNTTRVCMHE